MNRRGFLKLLSMGAIGATVDIDKLLWVPGEKTIFIPSLAQVDFVNKSRMDLMDIVAAELKRMKPKLHGLFEQEDYFYTTMTGKPFIIPVQFKGDSK